MQSESSVNAEPATFQCKDDGCEKEADAWLMTASGSSNCFNISGCANGVAQGSWHSHQYRGSHDGRKHFRHCDRIQGQE